MDQAHPSIPWQRFESRTRRRGPALNIALFAITFFTTALASALNQGVDVFSEPGAIRLGFPFAITVMTILLSHELGHYFLARFHGVDVTLPFFIPAPPLLVGTFGAFIRMRSLPPDRRALFDIGAAGPWAGFVVAVPAVILGLMLSEVRPLQASEGGLILGDSLLFAWLTRLVLGVSSQDVTIMLHPIALAGWFGFFVTCLNLLPAGQLDGGHVAYAVFGRNHRWVSRGVLAFLLILGSGALLGRGGWPGWLFWGFMLLVLGVDHPRPYDPVTPLDRRRVVAAFLTLIILILTFMPEPFSVVEPSPRPPIDFGGERTAVSAPAPPPHHHGLVLSL